MASGCVGYLQCADGVFVRLDYLLRRTSKDEVHLQCCSMQIHTVEKIVTPNGWVDFNGADAGGGLIGGCFAGVADGRIDAEG